MLAGNVYLSEIAPQLAPKLAKRIMPVGTYIIATEPIDTKIAKQLIPTNAAVCDTNFDLDYFRLSAPTQIEGPLIIYGGRISYCTLTPPKITYQL